MNKSTLRKQVLSVRKQMSDAQVIALSRAIFEKLKSTNILNYRNILAYSDFKNEVKTKDIINYLAENKREVYLPKCDIKTKTFTPVKILYDKSGYVTNSYGIIEPAVEIIGQEETKIDCVIVPGIVFDKNGNRIGFGCGYYDKFLKENPNVYKIALCYEFQLTDCVDTDEYDVPMDAVITEKRIIFCNKHNR